MPHNPDQEQSIAGQGKQGRRFANCHLRKHIGKRWRRRKLWFFDQRFDNPRRFFGRTAIRKRFRTGRLRAELLIDFGNQLGLPGAQQNRPRFDETPGAQKRQPVVAQCPQIVWFTAHHKPQMNHRFGRLAATQLAQTQVEPQRRIARMFTDKPRIDRVRFVDLPTLKTQKSKQVQRPHILWCNPQRFGNCVARIRQFSVAEQLRSGGQIGKQF